MAKLIYSPIASLDGYVEDEQGRFDWAAPDDEVHAFVNDLERPVGTYLYGRRMYETMVFWETVSTGPDQSAVTRDFAGIWRAAEKIVYSRTLETASSARTRIERDFEPDAIRRLDGGFRSRSHCWRRRACRGGDQGGTGRRVPAAPRADHRRRRETRAAGRCPGAARAARRAALPEAASSTSTTACAIEKRSAEVRVRTIGVGGSVGVPRLDRSNLGRVGLARGLLSIERGQVRRERHRSIGCRGLQEPVVGSPHVPARGSPVAVQLDHPIDQVRADLGAHTGQG